MKAAVKVVRSTLDKFKRTREDDRLLQLRVWEVYGFYLTPEQKEIFLRLPSAETISRRRREMRAEFPETKTTETRRFNRFLEYRNSYGKGWK